MGTALSTIDDWISCLKDVASDYASHHLRFDESPTTIQAEPETARAAVYVTVLGDGMSIHLGLAATPEGCRALACALLGIRRRQVISKADIVDGMSEILNILAGKVKSRMSARDGSLKLGLPIFFEGEVGVGANIERAAAAVTLGPVPCELLVFRHKTSA